MKARSLIHFTEFAFVFAVFPAIAQIRSGTVVFAMFTKNDLILAVDSRANVDLGGGRSKNRDDQCKLSASNGKVIFAVAGLSQMDGPGGFDFVDTARMVASGVEVKSRSDLERLADSWALRTRATFKRISHDREWATVPGLGKPLVVGIFASRDSNGNIMISETNVTHVANSEPFTSAKTEDWGYGGNQYAARYIAGYGRDAISELYAGKTERAKANSVLAKRLKSTVTVSDMERTTIEFCQLVARWYPNEVGGPIDQVHLGPHGIEWLHRKQNCAGK